MNKKRFLVLLCVLWIAEIANAQSDSLILQSEMKKERKITYSFINEYGINIGAYFDGFPYVEINGIFVNNICFNKKQDMMGMGLGIGFDFWYLFMVPAFPIFVNYRHYFTSLTNLKPLINVALGTRVNIRGEAGLYSTIAGGFRYKYLSFTSGFSINTLTNTRNNTYYYGGVEIKVGYTF